MSSSNLYTAAFEQARFSDESEEERLSDVAADDEGWEDTERGAAEEEEVEAQCLLCETVFGSTEKVLGHTVAEHGFDLRGYRRKFELDFYSTIKLINYIRSRIIINKDDPARVIADLTLEATRAEVLAEEKYLLPVLEDDALLYAFEDEEDVKEEEAVDGKDVSPEKRARILEEQLARLRSEFTEYQEMVRRNFQETLKERIADGVGAGKRDANASASTKWDLNEIAGEKKEKVQDDDTHYFTSYAGNEIHETMLKDTVRTEGYRDFIYDNKHLFKDKVVLDVGCGTGILSMFCARAGAKRVIGVDNSDIIDKARANVFENGLDGQITLLRGKIEEVVLPVKQVDIIVSEWMGYCLLYEAMLDSVLFARDKYLNPTTGIMVPSHINLAISTLSDSEFVNDRVNFWNEIYGFKMTAMKEKIDEDVIVTGLGTKSLSSTPTTFCHLPLGTVTVEELSFIKPFELRVDGGGDGSPKAVKEGEEAPYRELERLDGFVIYFDTFFLPSAAPYNPARISAASRAETWQYHDAQTGGTGIAFTTGPYRKITHWQQGVLLVNEKNTLEREIAEGDKVVGTVEYRKRKENSRELEIEMSWEVVREGDEKDATKKQLWYMR
ncbi:S-adenosyl-L-methionine-dependent methyltransferase [Peziza echinospora]|nr:S-adenosyl-L-methionine-dependent methyltransferase [Peziza echinospora]